MNTNAVFFIHTMNKNQKKTDTRVGRKSHRLNQVVGSHGTPVISNAGPQHLKQNIKYQRKNVFIEDVYEKAQSAKDMTRGKTGLVYDERMVNHRCLWDPAHQESPLRFTQTLQRCEELGLVERCEPVSVREATEQELLTVHSQAHINTLRLTDSEPDVDALEKLASNYDAVYIHPDTYKLALLSAGCTVQLIHEICTGAVHNGMAIVRPPGHHAMQEEYNGYCFFNNVAVAVRHALDQLNLHRILIVDWDVHHGQATQRMFYHDPRVVYFSIHRYENGEFWPNLRESNFDHIGEGAGTGFNFNIPLNTTGQGDAEYMAIFHQILLPMASEFQPELVVISAGYDAAIGCPEGEMSVTPACYAHLVSSLMGLASGKVAVVLEGGYCVRSLAESAALTLRALLGDPCPNLPPLSRPSHSVEESILNCIYSHRAYWQCFQLQGSYKVWERDPDSTTQHWPQSLYSCSYVKPTPFPTRNTCPVQTQHFKDQLNLTLDRLITETTLFMPKKVCFVYDPMMMEHRNIKDAGHPEKPSRIQRIYEKHLEYKLLDRLLILQSRSAVKEELLLVHDDDYLTEVTQLCVASEHLTDDIKYKHAQLEKKKSVYFHQQSYKSASLAVGSLLQVVDSVLRGESRAGVAVVRPPGHHAESYEACGFCIFNNISIAAKYAIQRFNLKRILILDWDVHHGNGTQRIFLSDPQVLYISIHRYDHGTFFPHSEDGAATVVGSGPGVGFNVNIPWNQRGMGNVEYVAAFLQVVLPIAYQFSPELVLVSAGFDAAVGDPLGGCKVSPETYGLLTSWLSPLAMGRLILCLEGGYNLTSISYSMTLCTKTLLGDAAPPVNLHGLLRPSAVADLRTVLTTQAPHWPALCFNKELPMENILNKDSTKENNPPLDKLHQGDASDDIEEAIEELNIQFGSQINISPSSTILNDSPKPDLLICDSYVTQVPNSDNESKPEAVSSPVEAQPGSSQGAAGNSSTTQMHITIMDSVKVLVGEEGFAVYPRHDCPHLPAVRPIPAAGIDVSASCTDCPPDCAAIENWTCLTCYSVCCGRVINEHMLHHSLELSHPIVLGFQDLSVWCYICDSYIESEVLYEAKNAAYKSKFGEEMPNIYTGAQEGP